MSGYAQPNRTLVSQDDAAYIEKAAVPRSTFVNQWSRKTAFDAGIIIPILVDEILPGDHVKYDVTAYLRMSTPLFPLFDQQRVDTHFFFVPNRLVWQNWVKMMGEQTSPGDSINYTVPTVYPLDAVGNIYDHMGIPGVNFTATPYPVNSLPLRMYNLIYNTWFMDENSGVSPILTTGDGPDLNTYFQLLPRAKSHDYFTSCLPWPQKFTAPTIPLAGTAPVYGLGFQNTQMQAGPLAVVSPLGGPSSFAFYKGPIDATGVNNQMYAQGTSLMSNPLIYADLSTATGISINTLRQAWMIQSLTERDARGGTRYVELLKSHFGVTNPDFRLQRPEYIGGGQTPLNITPIAQTAPTTGVPLGAIGAAGTAAGTHRASYAATEHGFVIGLISVKSELSYQTGLHKMWSRQTRYDYYWPALAQLGEQAVLIKEIYAKGSAADNTVFGYQERWQEYRVKYSDVTGIMRSNAPGTLDAWHLAQKFTSQPALNFYFMKDEPPMTRILAAAGAATGQQYLCDINYHSTMTRALPTYGTPAQLGRF